MINSNDIPNDVAILNCISNCLFILFGFILTLGGGWYLLNSVSNINKLIIYGDSVHHGVASFRSVVVPNLIGNFYTINLYKTRLTFEALPWIHSVSVKRVFPDQIKVYIQEHKPIAIWGPRDDDKMINEDGGIFDSNAGDGGYEVLPQFIGPEAQSNLILNMYHKLNSVFTPLDVKLIKIELSPRGSWTVMLEGGAQLELGRGSPDVVLERIKFFAGTLGMATANLNKNTKALQYADLRHVNGYALKVNGITTHEHSVPTAVAKK